MKAVEMSSATSRIRQPIALGESWEHYKQMYLSGHTYVLAWIHGYSCSPSSCHTDIYEL